MMNGTLRFVLGLANMPDGTVADIEKTLPGAQRLVAAARQIAAVAQKSQPLEAHVEQIEPLLKGEWADAVAAMPTAEEVLAWAAT
jgi:hypothetical protein